MRRERGGATGAIPRVRRERTGGPLIPPWSPGRWATLGRRRVRPGVVAISMLVVAVAVVLVAASLQRPEPPTFAPSPVVPDSAAAELVGPRVHTVDATASDRWTHFSFHAGSVIENPGPTDWDLAVRRFQIIANGGQGFFGTGGVLDLGDVPFDSVSEVPVDGYVPTTATGDSINEAIRDWYDYSFLSHLLTPLPRTYAIRTADGRFAKIEILGYYCPGGIPGCVTFRYAYQGDGTPVVEPINR